MGISKVIAKPTIYTFTGQGRVFQLLSGGEVYLRFRGIDDAWSEEVVLTVGDSLKFDRDYSNIEISSEFETAIVFYSGFADMHRAKTDLTPLGASLLNTGSVTAEKSQKLLVANRRNRRSLTIIPLDCMIYIGGLGTGINDCVPVAAGQPITLDITAGVYMELAPNHSADTGNVRYLEEIN